MTRKTLLEVTKKLPLNGHHVIGFFYNLYTVFSMPGVTPDPPPWIDPNAPDVNLAHYLDDVYYYTISGQKLISPLTEAYVDPETGKLFSDIDLAKTILSLYNTAWTKEWATLSAEYNPIENYSMAEEMTNDITEDEFGHVNTREVDLTDERTPDLTHAKTGKDTTTPDLTLKQKNDVYGFNSTNPVPSAEQEQTSEGTQEIEYDTEETDTGTDTMTHSGSDTNTESGKNTRTRNYTLTRSGNIGVTTSQQMLESERNLWMWNFFRNIVFPDLDKVLTILAY